MKDTSPRGDERGHSLLYEQGIAIKEIVRRTGYSRGLIRKFSRTALGRLSNSTKLP